MARRLQSGPVLRAIFEGYEACEKLNEAIRKTIPSGDTPPETSSAIPLPPFVGCDRDEIALLRNCHRG